MWGTGSEAPPWLATVLAIVEHLFPGENTMSERKFPTRLKFQRATWRLLCVGLACLASAAFAADDVVLLRGKPTKEQILDVLAAPPMGDEALGNDGAPNRRRVMRTRGLSLNAAGSATAATDASKAEFAQQAVSPVAAERKLDLQILFALNSDQLTREGLEVLDQLGAALGSERLNYVKSITFEGHTDVSGSAEYNQDLSRRRAERVRAYLTSRFGANGREIHAVGKGSRELADPSRPADGINRRVRIIVEG
jgi:outer membrane protein OmpA-like peptidoglycan-associated protein